ncbi:hypothetical protein [uncultured Sphingobacterium sp.]|uniref:hypothetical protein n=1 Tax=uncultured Sphingobacterium sp. TaxID=182688 RepID=UPI003748B1B3
MEIRRFFIAILFISLCNLGFGQRIRLESAGLTNVSFKGNVIFLKYNAPTAMRFYFMMSKPAIAPWSGLPVKGEAKLFYYKDNQEVVLVTAPFTNADWPSGGTFSQMIQKDFTVPANTVTVSNPVVDVQARWRYYKEGYPDPETTNGWTEWYYASTRPFALNPDEIPASSFSGPNSTCGESVYTITNPYKVTLENAAGIATLTSLGNNQWKVIRIGNAVGTVILRSTYEGKVFNYPIEVSSEMKGTIDGPVGIKQGWNDNYFYFKPEPGMDYTNVNWSVDSPHLITTQVDKYTFKISVPTNYPLMDKGRGDDVEIYIRSNGECGVMEKSRILRILPARPIKN